MNKRFFYIDFIKTLSIFLVFVLHIEGSFVDFWQGNPIYLSIGNIFQALSIIAVPLFVISSGFLAFNKKIENNTIFILKKVLPLIFVWLSWGVIRFFWEILVFGKNFHNFSELGQLVGLSVLSRFWFMPMIVGLFMSIPIFYPIVNKARKDVQIYFLVLWFLAFSVTESIKNLSGIELVPNLNSSVLLMFIPYIGFFLFGGFVRKNTNMLKLKTSSFKMVLFIFFSSLLFSLFLNDYSYLSINVVVQSFSGFIVLIRLFELLDNKFVTLSSLLVSRFTLELYLVQRFIIELLSLTDGFEKLASYFPLFLLPILSIIVFMLGLGTIYFISLIPMVNKLLLRNK